MAAAEQGKWRRQGKTGETKTQRTSSSGKRSAKGRCGLLRRHTEWSCGCRLRAAGQRSPRGSCSSTSLFALAMAALKSRGGGGGGGGGLTGLGAAGLGAATAAFAADTAGLGAAAGVLAAGFAAAGAGTAGEAGAPAAGALLAAAGFAGVVGARVVAAGAGAAGAGAGAAGETAALLPKVSVVGLPAGLAPLMPPLLANGLSVGAVAAARAPFIGAPAFSAMGVSESGAGGQAAASACSKLPPPPPPPSAYAYRIEQAAPAQRCVHSAAPPTATMLRGRERESHAA
jgi:hypothetical protein